MSFESGHQNNTQSEAYLYTTFYYIFISFYKFFTAIAVLQDQLNLNFNRSHSADYPISLALKRRLNIVLKPINEIICMRQLIPGIPEIFASCEKILCNHTR